MDDKLVGVAIWLISGGMLEVDPEPRPSWGIARPGGAIAVELLPLPVIG